MTTTHHITWAWRWSLLGLLSCASLLVSQTAHADGGCQWKTVTATAKHRYGCTISEMGYLVSGIKVTAMSLACKGWKLDLIAKTKRYVEQHCSRLRQIKGAYVSHKLRLVGTWNHVLSVEEQYARYAGTAAPLHTTEHRNLDLRTGKAVTLKQAFPKRYSALMRRLPRYKRRQLSAKLRSAYTCTTKFYMTTGPKGATVNISCPASVLALRGSVAAIKIPLDPQDEVFRLTRKERQRLKKLIKGTLYARHSFWVDLRIAPDSYFVSYTRQSKGRTQAFFAFVKGGRLASHLPRFAANKWALANVKQITAVAFRDINGDGRKDITAFAHCDTDNSTLAQDYTAISTYFQSDTGFRQYPPWEKKIFQERPTSFKALKKLARRSPQLLRQATHSLKTRPKRPLSQPAGR